MAGPASVVVDIMQAMEPHSTDRDFAVTFLEQAIDEAVTGVRSGAGGPFGAVIVRAGRVIARAHNLVTSTLDPTAHAEIVAIRNACQVVGDFRLTDATLYASCEPCPMCLSATYWARIHRVFHAASREDAAAAGFDDLALYAEIKGNRERGTVSLRRVEHHAATDPFSLWREMQDRTPY